jgi:hypothetical protein
LRQAAVQPNLDRSHRVPEPLRNLIAAEASVVGEQNDLAALGLQSLQAILQLP